MTPASGERLRDRYFALAAERPPRVDPDFLALVQTVPPAQHATVDGLRLSFHPTRSQQVLRHVAVDRLPEAVRPLFARTSPSLSSFAAAFVDPAELSLFTFENLIGLDEHFASAQLVARPPRELGEGVLSLSLEPDEATQRALAALDGLGLYAPPFDPAARGGTRFIFHAAPLAQALTTALRATLPPRWLDGFVHVNPVFRCNAFEPDDAEFRWHHDTPYWDRARKHVSRFTVLLYVSPGAGRPALRFEHGVEVEAFEPFTCLVFDQRLTHEGRPFTDGRKVFLRTELLFETAELPAVKEVGALFGRACYLGSQGPFDARLAAWAREAYEQVALGHFGAQPNVAAAPLLKKSLDGASWVSNGFDFWFPASAELGDCAVLAVLDFLNGTLRQDAVWACAKTELLPTTDRGAIGAALDGPWTSPFFTLDDELRSQLLPAPELEDDDCCPTHTGAFRPARNVRVNEVLRERRREAAQGLERCAVAIFGQRLFLQRSLVVVRGGKVHLLTDRQLPPLHFAASMACWDDGVEPADYVGAGHSAQGLKLLVPPIPYATVDGCHHLQLDVFRNDWLVDVRAQALVFPCVRAKPVLAGERSR